MSDDIPMWAAKEAIKRANSLSGGSCWLLSDIALGEFEFGVHSAPLTALARLIAKHEPEPVDPLLEMAREAAARMHEGKGVEGNAMACRAGGADDWPAVVAAFTALRMAKEQGLPE